MEDPTYDENGATLFADLSTLTTDFKSMRADMRLMKWMVAATLVEGVAILLLLPCTF